MTTALILVDLQNDFLQGGSLPVPHGDTVLPLASRLEGRFKWVVATQEWHPANHNSFVGNHPGRTAGEVVKYKKQMLTLELAHCIQRTRGAELASGLMLNRVNKVFRKGTDAEIDSYSGFFDQGRDNATGLHNYLREKKITHLYLLGLTTEGCVKHTALDALDLGFKPYVIEDGCRTRIPSPEAAAQTITELKRAGIGIIHSRDLLKLSAKQVKA